MGKSPLVLQRIDELEWLMKDSGVRTLGVRLGGVGEGVVRLFGSKNLNDWSTAEWTKAVCFPVFWLGGCFWEQGACLRPERMLAYE